MKEVIDFVRELDLHQIVIMWGAMWYFTKDLKAQMVKLDEDLRSMNSRTSRLEGTVYERKIYGKK